MNSNRRTFLKKSALGAIGSLAVPTILPSTVFGKNAPSSQITIGMIGTGRQAINVNLKQFLSMKNVRVIATCDPDHWRMNQASDIINKHYRQHKNDNYKGVNLYNDYRELLANKSVDAVMISSPDHWHIPHGIASAMEGKHVCTEKALSVCINHIQALVDAVNKHKVHHRLDSEFRTKPYFSNSVGLVRAGVIGKLTKVVVGVPRPLNGSAPGPQPTLQVPKELDYDLWLGPAPRAPYATKRVHERNTYNVRPGWMRNHDYCNGMITNWGAHLIDIALWGMDKEQESPVSVEGIGSFTTGIWNTINSFKLEYKFSDGITMEYITDKPFVKFEGEKGWIKVPYNDPVEASNESILKENVAPEFENILSDKEDFINSIVNNTSSLEPLEVGHNVYRICNMGLLAIKLERKLNWDKGQFKNDNAANAMLYRPIRTKYVDKRVVDWLEQYEL